MSEQGKRKHLGRGLSALFGDEPPEGLQPANQREGRALPVEYLQGGAYQPRRQFE